MLNRLGLGSCIYRRVCHRIYKFESLWFFPDNEKSYVFALLVYEMMDVDGFSCVVAVMVLLGLEIQRELDHVLV